MSDSFSVAIAKRFLQNPYFLRLWRPKDAYFWRKFRTLLCRCLYREEKGKIKLINEDGFYITCDIARDHGNARNMLLNGNYESGTCAMIEKLLPVGGTFVDAGAHLGHMSLLAAKKVGKEGKVLAIEGSPEMWPLLEQNFMDNGFDDIRLCRSLIGKNGDVDFLLHPTNAGSCRMVTPQERDDLEMLVRDVNNRKRFDLDSKNFGKLIDVTAESADLRFIRVQSHRFTEILEIHKIDHIDLLKIDIEGAEMLLLEDAEEMFRSPSPPIVIVECSLVLKKDAVNGESFMANEIWLFFQKLGWRAYKLSSGKKNRKSDLKLVDSKADVPSGNENLYFFPPDRPLWKSATEAMR